MRIATFIFIGLALLGASGCATVNESFSADGKKAYSLNCSGTARGWDKCLSAAGEICGAKGYDVLDRSSEEMATIGGGTNGFFGAKTNERSMLITCKK